MATTYSSLPNELLSVANGVDYAYRDTSGGSDGAIALILLQHFRGNLDNWDPALVDALARTRRVIAPQGAAGMHGWAPEVINAVGTPKTSPEEYLSVFFTRSEPSRQTGKEALRRMYARTEDRDAVTTWATREAQYDAVCAWGLPDHALLEHMVGNPANVPDNQLWGAEPGPAN
jgi:hypothetical protein